MAERTAGQERPCGADLGANLDFYFLFFILFSVKKKILIKTTQTTAHQEKKLTGKPEKRVRVL